MATQASQPPVRSRKSRNGRPKDAKLATTSRAATPSSPPAGALAPSRPARHGVGARRVKPRVPLGTRVPPLVRAGAGANGSGPGSFPDFIYNGGPVVTDPQMHMIYLGDWSATSAQTRATHLDTFIGDLMNSPFMNNLAQYGCGSSGTFAGSVFIANSNNNLLDSDLHTFIQNAIDGGTLPEPGAGSGIVYALILDDNTGVNDGDNILCEPSGDNAFGYHGSFTTAAGNPAYYAVVPGLTDTCLQNSCPGGNSTCTLQTTLTQEQRQTKVLSHEFAEMVTDPEVGGNFGWNDADPGVGEAGDICNDTITTITIGSNTWTIQPIYSKTDDMQTDGATTCVVGVPSPYASLLPTVSIIVDRSTFGVDEVTAAIASSPTPGSYTYGDAFYVVLYGFSPDELGLNSANLHSPPLTPQLSGAFHGLSQLGFAFDSVTGVQLEDASQSQMIQDIVFPYNITFTGEQAFTDVPATPGYVDYDLTATIALTPTGTYPELNVTRSGTATFQLVLQADPYMTAGETWWLSEDIRVFSVTPEALATGQAPLENSSTLFGSDPNDYVTRLLGELNTFYNGHASTVEHPFDTLTDQEDASALELSETDPSGQPVYNFALARVHLQGDTASDVRAFFRLFISSSPDTSYDQSTTFRRSPELDSHGNPIPGTAIPLLGYATAQEPSTIPFFAAPRIDATAASTATQTDTANVQTIPDPDISPAPAPGSLVTAYFGCYLDINQTTPRFPLNPSSASTPDGPWHPSELHAIPALIMGNHACLVTEIAYDSDPIPPQANASSSDKLGQRNLAWGYSTPSGGGGSGAESAASVAAVATRTVPGTFSLRAGPRGLLDGLPADELMIEWGAVPPGSSASIYWPAVAADDVLALAASVSPVRALTKLDANTIGVTTGSVTFIPIPPNASGDLAGLLTLQLADAPTAEEDLRVVVRRVASRLAAVPDAKESRRPVLTRYVVGAFELRVAGASARELLPAEETLLGVLKWKLAQLPASNRWTPVLARYVQQVGIRVNGLGGDPGLVPPSLQGYPGAGHHRPGPGPHRHPHPGRPRTLECTGKVTSLRYDRFGDFAGFHLRTEEDREREYRSRELEIARLARDAWRERMVISVCSLERQPEVPAAIILRRAPLR